MAMETFKEGDVFSSEKYKPYTKSDRGMVNPVVEFPVWPALSLHDGGPLVAKGIAQPKDSKGK